MAAILPLAETVLLGAVDGALRGADVKAGRGTTTFKQFSTYLELGAVGLGAIAATQRVHPDWWEPLVLGGLFALSQRAGAWAGHQAGIGGPGDAFGGGDSFGGPAVRPPQRRPVGGPANPGAFAPWSSSALPPAAAIGPYAGERRQPAGMLA